MNASVFQVVRICLVLAFVCSAAAVATPKGRLPLALRGVAKFFRISRGEQTVPAWKRTLSFVFILLAVLLALI